MTRIAILIATIGISSVSCGDMPEQDIEKTTQAATAKGRQDKDKNKSKGGPKPKWRMKNGKPEDDRFERGLLKKGHKKLAKLDKEKRKKRAEKMRKKYGRGNASKLKRLSQQEINDMEEEILQRTGKPSPL